MSTTVAIQGYQASFHDIAARQYFGHEITLVPCETFAATFAALKNKHAEVAIVAIENSLFGSINEVYDDLLSHHFWVEGEVYLRVAQCLIGLPGSTLEIIKEVHSHLVALAQCEDFLDKKLPHAERFEHHDTAASVADIKQWGDPTKAAIASHQAAELYGLNVLAEEIETNKQNYTRFVVVRRKSHEQPAANKASLVVITDHKPGALFRTLGLFANKKMNLTKLQSRPIIGQAWHYLFYIDVMHDKLPELLPEVITALKTQGCDVTLLGLYPSSQT